MISPVLLELVRCPDCRGRLVKAVAQGALRCQQCGHLFESGAADFLVLKPNVGFVETTKFLEDSFHADGRDETVSPPLLSAGIRNTMLRRFLEMNAGDIVLDLGCGSGRFAVWSQESGAHVVGIDTGSYFAREARSGVDLVVGELRQLAFADAAFSKAYAIDVFEHLSEEGLLTTLREVARVLVPKGKLFVYTHVRQRSPLGPLLTLVGRTASLIEHLGLSDLTIEKLRKTDHLNPLKSRRHLDDIADATGFRIDRFRYYTPLVSSIAENILVPVAAHAMARRSGRSRVDCHAMRLARTEAKQRIAARGFGYRALRLMTHLTMFDVAVLGGIRSGPFFARFVKK